MSDLTPTAVANQALDAAGADFTLGDLEEGTRAAQVCLRAYRNCVQQLLRAAHWNFARKQAPLVLIADATGQTANVGTLVPVPWIYSYQYPVDCMKARFIPWNPFGNSGVIPANNAQLPNVPLTTGTGNIIAGGRLQPARFLVGTDFNYLPPPGAQTWQTQGTSPQGRTVILTNVKDATLVYTSYVMYPSLWDSLFRAAVVAYLAAEIALPLANDKKFGLQMRTANLAIVKMKLNEARIIDGNEDGFPNTDHTPDWMRARQSQGNYGRSDGPGVWGYGWDSCGFEGGGVSSAAAF